MAVASCAIISQNNTMILTAERSAEIDDFLAHHGWGGAARRQIAGDASFRRYERIACADGISRVVMDAPPEKEDVEPFILVQSCLWKAGYSVPEILASDTRRGFLLLEDVGDDSFTRVLAQHPQQEEALYAAAIDVLADLYQKGVVLAQGASMPLAPYQMELLEREAGLLVEWFLPLIMEKRRAASVGAEFMDAIKRALLASDLSPRVLVHRDFHADNLFWLADRVPAMRRVAMLDFQDAVIGRPGYDLVSLLEDARRDISPAVVQASLRRYCDLTGMHAAPLMQEYALYGAQRNAKILGIFSRLRLRDGKPRYLSLIPRVWGHFIRDLSHPALSEVKAWAERHFTPDDIAVITQSNLAERAYA